MVVQMRNFARDVKENRGDEAGMHRSLPLQEPGEGQWASGEYGPCLEWWDVLGRLVRLLLTWVGNWSVLCRAPECLQYHSVCSSSCRSAVSQEPAQMWCPGCQEQSPWSCHGRDQLVLKFLTRYSKADLMAYRVPVKRRRGGRRKGEGRKRKEGR